MACHERACGEVGCVLRLARPAGFEPATFGSGGQRSIQLSYGRTRRRSTTFALACQPKLTRKRERRLARPEGFEPPTYGFEARRSIQLSYGRTTAAHRA